MKSLPWLCALALVTLLVPSFAAADDSPPLATKVQLQVDTGLLKPLADVESHTSRFSRIRRVPAERRPRVVDTAAKVDKAGREFVTFAIDVKYGDKWRENDIVGCDYPKTASLYVKIGDGFRPASFLLGKDAEPVAGVCAAAPPASPPPAPRS